MDVEGSGGDAFFMLGHVIPFKLCTACANHLTENSHRSLKRIKRVSEGGGAVGLLTDSPEIRAERGETPGRRECVQLCTDPLQRRSAG